ncbi:MAG: DegT/DnrJ/EryC1/StrS family aminotransferase [Promethearchaeota archaeon]|jgi:dTDP-4-amino-4,6-dideoxygalactose transaminase
MTNKNVKFVDMSLMHSGIKSEFMSIVSDIVDKNAFIDNQYVKQFEEEFAKYCGAKYCVAVNSGTSALHLAALSLDIKKCRYAIPNNSFFATYSAMRHANAESIMITDIGKDHNMDMQQLKEVYDQIDVVVPVSLYGNVCDLDAIDKDKHVIHDAAQAHGSYYKGKRICDFADLTCFSFYPAKNLGAFGEGGAIVTNNKEYYDRMKMLKNHGQSRRYYHDILGYNYRLNEIQAASLCLKLRHLDEWNDQRREAGKRYNENLKENQNLLTLVSDHDCVYHLYPVFIKDKDYYNKLIGALKDSNIQHGFHYPVNISDQAASKSDSTIVLKHSSPLWEYQELSLPIFPGITNKEIDYVCEVVNSL